MDYSKNFITEKKLSSQRRDTSDFNIVTDKLEDEEQQEEAVVTLPKDKPSKSQ